MKNSWKAIGLAACLAVLLLLLCALPRRGQWLSLARDPDLIRRFTGWIDSIGSAGIPVLLLFQIFQIVVAILPGGLVELAGGILYGPFGGFAVALFGILLGTLCAFWISRRFGEPLVRRLVNGKQFDRYKKLCASRRFEAAALLFFFLPGVPKDILIYTIGCSGVLSRRFILHATLARIPSVAVSCFAGSVAGKGDFLLFTVIYAAFLAAGGIGTLVHRRILRRLEQKEK